jgi:heptosyltransferase I
METLSRILIIKLGSIGDVVHTLPAVADLKYAFPEIQVDWLVERKASVILTGNPLLHEVIEVDTQSWRRSPLGGTILKDIIRKISHLRRQRYDLALDFQGLWKSAAFGYFSGAKRLIGFDRENLREPSCRLLYDEAVIHDDGVHHVIDIYRLLSRRLGAAPRTCHFELNVPVKDEAYITSQLSLHQTEKFVILNPGGGWETKNWDPKNYAELCQRLRQSLGLKSVITWGPGEEDLVEKLRQFCRTDPPAIFPTTIPQYIALARRAVLFVGGDTGPMHLASACGTPVVGIFGPTDPRRNGPFHSEDRVVFHRVDCGPCYKRSCVKYQQKCIRLVTVDEVFEAVEERLGQKFGQIGFHEEDRPDRSLGEQCGG